jgi:hypothetical protein
MSISAFNALTFLFIFLFGNRMWKDYMFYIGVISGFLACAYPISAYGRFAFGFDAIRFFTIHGIICVCPILMVMCGFHRLDWRTSFFAPLTLLIVFCVILVNEVVMTAVGIIDQDMSTLLSNVDRNGAMVFGPEPQSGAAGKLLDALCPKFFKTALWDAPSAGITKGDRVYFPILWIIIPGFVIFAPVSFLLSLCFDFKNFRAFITHHAKKLSRLKRSS